jgi:hypothetical protein
MPGTCAGVYSHTGEKAWKGDAAMKRYMLVFAALMLLMMPVVVGADDKGWVPPEWSPTPPSRPSVDVVQLVQMLVAKGVISDQEYAQLTHPQPSAAARPEHARAWTWQEIDRNPVRSSR